VVDVNKAADNFTVTTEKCHATNRTGEASHCAGGNARMQAPRFFRLRSHFNPRNRTPKHPDLSDATTVRIIPRSRLTLALTRLAP
jgi:hypothetical protein